MSQDTPPNGAPPIAADPPPQTKSALQREVEASRDGTTTISHFGRDWVIPLKRHMKHIAMMRNGFLSGYGAYGLLIAETFLSHGNHENVPEGQVDALYELNPPEEELEAFAKKLTEALGLGDSGNSLPSSPS